MKFPKSLYIAGHKHVVSYPQYHKYDGTINHSSHKITIPLQNRDNKRAMGEIAESLLHELMHGINRRYLPYQYRVKEAAIEQLAKGLYQVLHQNKIRF